MLSPITLFQFPQTGNIPNLSPFCMKVETYLRMCKIPYQVKESMNPRKAPRKKFPYIQYGDQILSDSSLIIARLEADSDTPLNHHLDAQQRAETLCVQRMLEDHFYWTMVYSRWCSKAGWPKWSASFRKKFPPIINTLILSFIKNKAVKQLNAQGMGRFDDETVHDFSLEDLSALNIKIGNRAYYFNNQPSTLDAIIYSFLASCLAATWHLPMKEYILVHHPLKNYVNNLQARYFPELKGF